MRAVSIAFARALLSQLHIRMLLLTLVPFALSLLIWGIALSQGLNPIIESIHSYFRMYDGFRMAGGMLTWIGLSAINTVIVPLIAMWLLLPLVILTTLVFVGAIAMPLIVSHVGKRRYPTLEMREGGSVGASLWRSTLAFFIFVVFWIAMLPLNAIPVLALIAHPLLMGWFTCRVLTYDALAKHADAHEMNEILRIHRWRLLLIGTVAGALGAIPSMIWLGGVWFVWVLPVMALVAIWLYVLVFIFAGLWFVYYCLDALAKYRSGDVPAHDAPQAIADLKDIH